jgi:hypothetical protein
MAKNPKSNKKRPEPPKDTPGPEFERFEALTKRLVEVSKRELDEKRNGD